MPLLFVSSGSGLKANVLGRAYQLGLFGEKWQSTLKWRKVCLGNLLCEWSGALMVVFLTSFQKLGSLMALTLLVRYPMMSPAEYWGCLVGNP